MPIRTLEEQEAAAKSCGFGYCCLAHKRDGNDWTWYIALKTNSVGDADFWWSEQKGLARVYRSDGVLRNAK